MKKILSIILCMVMILLVIPIVTLSAGAADTSYRDSFIDSILKNEKVWRGDNPYINGGYLVFRDLNMDGKPEFIIKDYGGSMRNFSNDVYYYSSGKLVSAGGGSENIVSGYPGSLSLYYNKSTNQIRYLGSWVMRNGMQSYIGANYSFSFNGKNMSIKYYSGLQYLKDFSSGKETYTYYDGASDYGDLGNHNIISKSMYESINNKAVNGFVELKPREVSISIAEWDNYSNTSKKIALRESYDGFFVDYPMLSTPKITSLSNDFDGIKTGAAKYRVYRKTGSGSWTKLGDTTKTYWVNKAVRSGTKYTYTVRCVSKDGKSFTSGYDSKGKSITYIAAPKISKLQNISSGVTGAAKYRVYRKTGSGSWTKLGDTTKTYWVNKAVKSGTKYTYTVRCVSKDGKSFTSGYSIEGWSIKYSYIYTAVELAGKNLNIILDLMGGEYHSELNWFSEAFGTDLIHYVYNNNTLPGFAFATRDNDYYGIAIFNGAKLNDKISSDMTYKQVTGVLGEMDGGIAGSGNYASCFATVNGYRVVFCFTVNDYIRENRTGSFVSSQTLRAANPSLHSIGLMKQD